MTIPNRQFASVWNRSGDSGRVVVEQKGGVQRFLESRVVDAADPAFRSHIQVTKEVLEDIGEGKLPFLVILNKIDIVDSSRKALLEKEFPEAIAMSALNPEDIEALHSRLVTFSLHGYADWNPDPTKVSIL